MTVRTSAGADPASPTEVRRYETVVDGVLALVEERGLRAGQALPTERELAKVFGVSRNVMRQAFGVLEERGLLRTVRGSGRYLRDVPGGVDDDKLWTRSSSEIASIADLLEARALLEVQVVGFACDRRTMAEAGLIADLAGRLTSWQDNLAFHAAVAAATHNFVLERLVRSQAELAGELQQRERYRDAGELERMRDEHRLIAAAIASRDAPTAQAAMREHLYRTRDVVSSGSHQDAQCGLSGDV